jgi:hypothetical protein
MGSSGVGSGERPRQGPAAFAAAMSTRDSDKTSSAVRAGEPNMDSPMALVQATSSSVVGVWRRHRAMKYSHSRHWAQLYPPSGRFCRNRSLLLEASRRIAT